MAPSKRTPRRYREGDEPVPGYRLLYPLGSGGMGEVWKAISEGGGIEVAIKIINGLDKATGRKELRALQLVKNINHPNLAPILAFWMKDENGNILNDGVAPAGAPDIVDLGGEEEAAFLTDDARETPAAAYNEDDVVTPDAETANARSTNTSPLFSVGSDTPVQLIVAMGLGDQNLLDRLDECKAEGLTGIPPEELLDHFQASAKAIDLLNQKHNIQHCDIKPQNILLVSGSAQVCDFGLAKSTQDARTTMNNTFTVAYGAPEVLDSSIPSRQTDQFSLAISYYELRTGELPYAEQTFAGIMQSRQEDRFDFSRLAEAEREVIVRASQRDPHARFPDCLSMVKALQAAFHGRPISDSRPIRETWDDVDDDEFDDENNESTVAADNETPAIEPVADTATKSTSTPNIQPIAEPLDAPSTDLAPNTAEVLDDFAVPVEKKTKSKKWPCAIAALILIGLFGLVAVGGSVAAFMYLRQFIDPSLAQQSDPPDDQPKKKDEPETKVEEKKADVTPPKTTVDTTELEEKLEAAMKADDVTAAFTVARKFPNKQQPATLERVAAWQLDAARSAHAAKEPAKSDAIIARLLAELPAHEGAVALRKTHAEQLLQQQSLARQAWEKYEYVEAKRAWQTALEMTSKEDEKASLNAEIQLADLAIAITQPDDDQKTALAKLAGLNQIASTSNQNSILHSMSQAEVALGDSTSSEPISPVNIAKARQAIESIDASELSADSWQIAHHVYLQSLLANAENNASRGGDFILDALNAKEANPNTFSAGYRKKQAAAILLAAAAELQIAQPNQLGDPVYSPSKAAQANEYLAAISQHSLPLTPTQQEEADLLTTLAAYGASPRKLDDVFKSGAALVKPTAPIQLLWSQALGRAERNEPSDAMPGVRAMAELLRRRSEFISEPAIDINNELLPAMETLVGRFKPDDEPASLLSDLALIHAVNGEFRLTATDALGDFVAVQKAYERAFQCEPRVEYLSAQGLAVLERDDLTLTQQMDSLDALSSRALNLDGESAESRGLLGWVQLAQAAIANDREKSLDLVKSSRNELIKAEAGGNKLVRATQLRMQAEGWRLQAFIEPHQKEQHLAAAQEKAEAALEASQGALVYSAFMTLGNVLQEQGNQSGADTNFAAAFKEAERQQDKTKQAVVAYELARSRLLRLIDATASAPESAAQLAQVVKWAELAAATAPTTKQAASQSLLSEVRTLQAEWSEDATRPKLQAEALAAAEAAAKAARDNDQFDWPKYQREWAIAAFSSKDFPLAKKVAEELLVAARSGKATPNNDLLAAIEISIYTTPSAAQRAEIAGDHQSLFPGDANPFRLALKVMRGEALLEMENPTNEAWKAAERDAKEVLAQIPQSGESDLRADLIFQSHAIAAKVAVKRFQASTTATNDEPVKSAAEQTALAKQAAGKLALAIEAEAGLSPSNQKRNQQLRVETAALHLLMITRYTFDAAQKQELAKTGFTAIEEIDPATVPAASRGSFEKLRGRLAEAMKP